MEYKTINVVFRTGNHSSRRLVKIKCPVCGNDFFARPNVRTCSKTCSGKTRINRAKAEGLNEAQKQRARNKLNWAISSGKIVRPTVCERCAATNCEIVAHHHDYSKPFDVAWLCNSCHMKVHSVPIMEAQ